jgi:hypothetical protein
MLHGCSKLAGWSDVLWHAQSIACAMCMHDDCHCCTHYCHNGCRKRMQHSSRTGLWPTASSAVLLCVARSAVLPCVARIRLRSSTPKPLEITCTANHIICVLFRRFTRLLCKERDAERKDWLQIHAGSLQDIVHSAECTAERKQTSCRVTAESLQTRSAAALQPLGSVLIISDSVYTIDYYVVVSISCR